MNVMQQWAVAYLLNAAVQVPVMFGAAWLVARLARRMGPRLEHRVWVTALLLEATVPACSLRPGELLSLVSGWFHQATAGASGQVRVTTGVSTAVVHSILWLPAGVQFALLLVYGCSVLYFSGRLAWGVWRTNALQRQGRPVTLTGEALREWRRLAAAFGCKATKLAISAGIEGPVTVGCWRGVLLMPSGFLERVTPADWATVVAHEFAHIQRRDFLKNLLHGLVTLPVAWHPVVRLTRSRVAESREMVCDAVAAEAAAGQEVYARSLLRLASLLVKAVPVRGVHAIGIFDANLFERRIMKLTEKRVAIQGMRRVGVAVVCVAIGVATCGSALALRMEIGGPVAQAASSQAHGPAKVSGGVMAGQNLTKVNPVYPQDAKDAKITGAVVLKAIIGKTGLIENLQVVSGPEALRASSLEAVRQWVYKPYLLNGEAVEVETTITVTYSLQP